MKTIAVLCHYRLMPDRIGGMDAFFWEFDRSAKEQGYIVDWYFPNTAQHGEYSNLTIREAGPLSIEDSFLVQVTQHKQNYDFILCHFLELCTPFYKQVKKHLPQAQLIAVDHNPRPIGGYPLQKRITKRIKGILYGPSIDRLIGVSHYTVNELLRDFGSSMKPKTQVIYNGVLTHHIQRREKRSTLHPTFLTACHLRQSKGIQDLIEAVALLEPTLKKDIHIDVYGDGEYKEVLLQLIAEKELTNQFSFKGNSPDLGSVYFQYDYLLHPSHMECFSLGILESLAANVPVIAATVGGNAEVITNGVNGYLIEPKNIKQLQTLIETLYTGKQSIQSDTDTLIKQEYTLTRMVQQYLQLLT